MTRRNSIGGSVSDVTCDAAITFQTETIVTKSPDLSNESASQKHNQNSYPAALCRRNSLPPSLSFKAEQKKLPMELHQEIATYLSDRDIARMSSANRRLHGDVARQLKVRQLLDQSKNLSIVPRESRLEKLQHIIKDMPYSHTGVLNQLVRAYRVVPRNDRSTARQDISEAAYRLKHPNQDDVLAKLGLQLGPQTEEMSRVDAFHDNITQIAALDTNAQVDAFRQACGDISHLPADLRLDAVNTILGVPQDLTVLLVLVESIRFLPVKQRHEAFDVILNRTQDRDCICALLGRLNYLPEQHRLIRFKTILDMHLDPKVLIELASRLEHLQKNDQRIQGFHAILGKTNTTAVIGKFIEKIEYFPGRQRLEVFNSILNVTNESKILFKLSKQIHSLPLEQRMRGFNAIFGRTNDHAVLSKLVEKIKFFPRQKRLEVFLSILRVTQEPKIFLKLVKQFNYLPLEKRLNGFNAILSKTKDQRVLSELAKKKPYDFSSGVNVEAELVIKLCAELLQP